VARRETANASCNDSFRMFCEHVPKLEDVYSSKNMAKANAKGNRLAGTWSCGLNGGGNAARGSRAWPLGILDWKLAFEMCVL
jgi:hypothetical protein